MAKFKSTFKGRRKNIQRRRGVVAQFEKKRPGQGIGSATDTFRSGTDTFKALRKLRKRG